jgi:hypothetical protein
VESYIRSKVTEEKVSPTLEPVALYYRHPGMAAEEFCCVGSVMIDKDYGPVVLTAEHVFRTDIHSTQIIGFKPLRKSVHEPEYYLDRIIKTSRNLKGADAVVATFGSLPVTFAPFSAYVLDEIGKNFYGDVTIGKKKIPHVRSVVSGEIVPTVGYCRRDEGTNGQVFILIEYHTRPGESGTGFVDDYGGLWIVHASPEPDIERQMLDDCEKLTHKKVKALTTLSGPFGGKYD